ncbi:hypothetical protein HMPREF9089_00553 [Eubacterium brachy ATCC 33089]|nr:hypothetical protein HMPREF9089_00553 [Eubacterium brachy ATCC 33089]
MFSIDLQHNGNDKSAGLKRDSVKAIFLFICWQNYHSCCLGRNV